MDRMIRDNEDVREAYREMIRDLEEKVLKVLDEGPMAILAISTSFLGAQTAMAMAILGDFAIRDTIHQGLDFVINKRLNNELDIVSEMVEREMRREG